MGGFMKTRLTSILPEKDLQESFCRSGGPGGQNVNKVNTAVILQHLPTGLTVRAETARTQEQNRHLARERLAGLLAEKKRAAAALVRFEREQERRRHRPRPRGLKEKILRSKRHRSEVKKFRKSGRED